MLSSVLTRGDKLEIRVEHQGAKTAATEERPHVLRSVIYNIQDESTLEIAMPMEHGKLFLLGLGTRYEAVFFTRNGIFRSTIQVKERYKSNNLYLLKIEIKENLSKRQRREYYRSDCFLEMEYLPITPEAVELNDITEILKYYHKNFPLEFMRDATALDISGGGIRFISTEQMQESQELIVKVQLVNERVDMCLEILGSILSVKPVEGGSNKYEYRVKFSSVDTKTREEIIKYVFEEERKGRQGKKG